MYSRFYLYHLWKIEEELKRYHFEKRMIDFDWSSILREDFFLTGDQGNNSFLRNKETGLHIPAIRLGDETDISLGTLVVFCDMEDGHYLQKIGLQNYICGFSRSGTPIFVCDNHNIVLEAWQLLKTKKPSLIHIDQHKDNASIECKPTDSIYCTRICDYIQYAQLNQWIKFDYLSFVESQDLPKLKKIRSLKRKIVNIDIDFFVKDLSMITIEDKINIICQSCHHADLITIATSPGFIDQSFAIKVAKLLWLYL